MPNSKKIVFWIVFKIFSGAFLAVGLILLVCLIQRPSLWIKIVASSVVGILFVFGLATRYIRGSAVIYNYRFGIVIGFILSLLVALIFNFKLGVVFGIVFCLLFSIKDLAHKASELFSSLLSEIKYLWEQIRESIF